MLKNTYKKGVGIVHGSSNTGRFVKISISVCPGQLNRLFEFLGECIHVCVFTYLQIFMCVEGDMD